MHIPALHPCHCNTAISKTQPPRLAGSKERPPTMITKPSEERPCHVHPDAQQPMTLSSAQPLKHKPRCTGSHMPYKALPSASPGRQMFGLVAQQQPTRRPPQPHSESGRATMAMLWSLSVQRWCCVDLALSLAMTRRSLSSHSTPSTLHQIIWVQQGTRLWAGRWQQAHTSVSSRSRVVGWVSGPHRSVMCTP